MTKVDSFEEVLSFKMSQSQAEFYGFANSMLLTLFLVNNTNSNSGFEFGFKYLLKNLSFSLH